MTWVANTIAQYGWGMGIEGLAFDDNGLVCLDIETLGVLFIERFDSHVLVYLARELREAGDKALKQALSLCHFRQRSPFPVHAGYKDNHLLVFLARIPASDFSPAALEHTVQYLSGLHDQV